jgi:hypothetical protein
MVFISHIFSGLGGRHDLSPYHPTTPASHRPFGVLADVINQYLPPDLRLPASIIYDPLIVAVAVITTFPFFYIFYVLLYESYRS